MKINKLKINKLIPIILICIFIFIPKLTFAEELTVNQGVGIGFIGMSVVNNVIAYIANVILMVTSNLVTISGSFLSLSMKITLDMKNIYEGIKSIETVWRIIRDLSSMFIIFILIYESIKMILGLKDQKFSQTVVNIFIAGILINFSLFFFKVVIDASNLISLQFYNAITPASAADLSVTSIYTDGGLSNVFMQSLKIPKIYGMATFTKGLDATVGIIISSVSGILMMVVASISFFAASVSFVIRTGVLLFILAVSPLYFAGIIFPAVKSKVSDKIMGLLKSQCIFMPTYLFLMYISLKIISDEGFMGIFKVASQSENTVISLSLIIQFVISIIFINIPLVAAIEFGAVGAKWAPKAGSISKTLGSFAGRFTAGNFGRIGGKAFDSLAVKAQETTLGKGASKTLRLLGVSQAVRGGLSNMEKSKYGDKSLEDKEKEEKARAKDISALRRSNIQMANINKVLDKKYQLSGNNYDSDEYKNFKKELSDISSKEIEGFDKETILNTRFASSLSSKQVESLLKSEKLDPEGQSKFKEARATGIAESFEDEAFLSKYKMSDYESLMKEELNSEHKKKINDARLKGYRKIMSGPVGAQKLIENVLNNKASDIVKLPKEILSDSNVIRHLDANVLKKMVDDDIDRSVRMAVRNFIGNQPIIPVANANNANLARMQEYINRNPAF